MMSSIRYFIVPLILIWGLASYGAAYIAMGQIPPQATSYVNSIGVTLPPDAAPPSEQHVRTFQLDHTYMEWFRTIYKGTYGHRIIAEPLIRLDKDFNLLPAAAERWEPSADGLRWYFYIQQGLEFSDGRPLTAHDFVFTFRRGADPQNAYDVEWYYRPIKNWGKVVAGQLPLDSLGVQAIDDYTLIVETEDRCAYLPDLLVDSWVSPRQAIEKYGDAWSTSPATSIASGPFYLEEWSKANQVVLKANPKYHGPAKPYLESLVGKLYNESTPPPMLASYEANEVDHVVITNQAELARIKTDPVLRNELHDFANFDTYYLTMNTYVPPFDNRRVREAFSRAIDREAICKSALQGFAVPAFSMLPPGFPAAASEALKPYQQYNPVLARQRLAEAGYPEGRGFPRVELWVRRDVRPVHDAGEAVQAMIRQNLGIDLVVRNMEVKTFMDALNNHRLPIGLVRFGYDFVDPSSLMNLWLSNGRHAWKHNLFDQLVQQAGTIVGDPVKRMSVYGDAERILVEDMGGVFLWHTVLNQMWKSNIKGEALEPNKIGYSAWRGEQVGNTGFTLYVAKEVGEKRKTSSFWERVFGGK